MDSDTPEKPARDSGGNSSLPEFSLPVVLGTPLSPRALSLMIQQFNEEVAASLGFARMAGLAYVERERLLRGAGAVGMPDADPRAWEWPLSALPAGERAFRDGQILLLAGGRGLTPELQAHLPGETVLIPLR